MSDPYDPTNEFDEELDIPDDREADSVIAAQARFSKLVDVQSSAGTFGSTSAQLGQQVDDKLRRENEGKRKAGRDLEAALEAADPHGVIPTDKREAMLESRRRKRQP